MSVNRRDVLTYGGASLSLGLFGAVARAGTQQAKYLV